MAGLNASDKVRVTVFGTLFAQSVQNVFDYEITVGSTEASTQLALQAFANAFVQGNNPGLFLLACQAPQYVATVIRAQRMRLVRSRYAESAVGLPGTHADDCTTANVAATITKYGPDGTRSNIGSTHIGGVPASQMVGGAFTAAYKTKLTTAASKYVVLFEVPAETTEGRMIIYQTAAPDTTRAVVLAVARDTVRTMRRRTLGVGI